VDKKGFPSLIYLGIFSQTRRGCVGPILPFPGLFWFGGPYLKGRIVSTGRKVWLTQLPKNWGRLEFGGFFRKLPFGVGDIFVWEIKASQDFWFFSQKGVKQGKFYSPFKGGWPGF